MCVLGVIALATIAVTVLAVFLAALKTDAHLVKFTRVDLGVITCGLAVLTAIYLLK